MYNDMLTLYASSDVRDVKSNPRLAYCYMLVDDSGAVVAKMAENAPTSNYVSLTAIPINSHAPHG